MFLKPFRTKSNVQLKSSDRKKLQQRVSSLFGTAGATAADLQLLLPAKATVSQLKLITHSEDICTVYAADRVPMFFETAAQPTQLVPTVYALWLVPELVPAFTTHAEVLPRLTKGANLMLPGVIRQGQGQSAYGHHARDTIVAVNLTTNRAAVAIGRLAHSSHDLYMCGGQGVCVNIVHVFGDKLWSLEESLTQQIPALGAVRKTPTLAADFPALGAGLGQMKPAAAAAAVPAISLPKYQAPVEHFPALGGEKKRTPTSVAPASVTPAPATVPTIAQQVAELSVVSSGSDSDDNDDDSSDDEPDQEAAAEQPIESPTVDAAATEDDVLRRAFFTTLKFEGRKLVLPLLTSTFYRCHVVPAAERPIDLKRTTYKKLGKFLAAMADERYVTVREEQKGVEKIVAINHEHPELVEFVAHAKQAAGGQQANGDESNGASLFVTEMCELWLVTDATAKFWARFNLANGQGAEKAQLKRLLKEYVCTAKLQTPQNAQVVVCNELLAGLMGGAVAVGGPVEFDRLFATILGQMKHSFEMRQRNEVGRSAKNPTIQMQLATRSGNKKVTLVNNLEAFGIRMAEFEKACKLGVAASTTVTKLANQKGEQLLVQGNQVKFIQKLLTETYKIPAKNIVGGELAKKDKKPPKRK